MPWKLCRSGLARSSNNRTPIHPSAPPFHLRFYRVYFCRRTAISILTVRPCAASDRTAIQCDPRRIHECKLYSRWVRLLYGSGKVVLVACYDVSHLYQRSFGIYSATDRDTRFASNIVRQRCSNWLLPHFLSSFFFSFFVLHVAKVFAILY